MPYLLIPLRCAQRICALVIGVDKYHCKPSLRNAVRDARAVGDALQSKGAIIVNAINCTKSQLKVKIQEYLGLLRENDVAMLYFAGHGCEYKNAFRLFAISEGDESNVDADSVNLLVLINRLAASNPL